MANQLDPRLAATRPAVGVDAGYDEGLRSYMLSIYNYMASGVLWTGIVALFVATTPALLDLFYVVQPDGKISTTLLGILAMVSPLVIILVMNFGMNRLSQRALSAWFYAFATLMGISMSTIFIVYTGASIAQTFFISAAAFGSLSLYGYTTKRDLGPLGKFLLMGLVGLLVAMIANMFFKSAPMQWGLNILGVLIFAGFTAYDTQRLKLLYDQVQGTEFVGKTAVLGALTLYLNFINLFQFILSFWGNRN